MPDQTSKPVVAYLTGNYPMISHTFILREVLALRRLGVAVITASVRQPDAGEFKGKDEISALKETFYILRAARNPLKLLEAHVRVAMSAPKRWLSALGLAWRTRPPGFKALAWQIFYFLEAGILAAHLRRNQVDHLHNHFANSSCSVAMLASEMTGIPYSFTLHGPAIFFEPMWWRIDEKTRRARFVVCISHFARSQAMLFSDQECWDKLKIVHCGVTPSNYGRSDHETGVRRVLFVGRLAAVKGVPLLLQAFSALSARHPEARLVIVGDGPDRAALEAQADRLGIAGLTEFLGYQPQEAVAEELRRSEVLVLPSFAEGVPIVLMEAMASRIPVIASRVAGVPELVEDGVSGYLIPPGDVSALTACLESLVADAELCARMGEAGRSKVETEFDVDVEAGKLARLFAGLDVFEADSAEYGRN